MKIFRLLPAAILFIIPLIASAQGGFRLEGWQAHTSLFNPHDADIAPDGAIWAATSGGAYSYSPSTGDITVYRNIGELLSISLNFVKFNPNDGKVYFGSTDGIIDILDPETGDWTHVTDIRTAGFPNSTINDIVFRGELAYIAGGFGLSVFDTEKGVFVETVQRIGDFAVNAEVNNIKFHDGYIWVSVNGGVAKAIINSQIVNPASWTTYGEDEGLPGGISNKIELFGDKIYSISENEARVLESGIFNLFYSHNGIKDFSSSDEFGLLMSDGWSIFRPNQFIEIQHPGEMEGFEIFGSKILIYYVNKSLGIFENGTLDIVTPDCPSANYFRDLAIGIDGELVAATDRIQRARGFCVFDGNSWKNYDVENYDIGSNGYYKVSVHPNGNYLLSNAGAGLLVAEKSSGELNFSRFNNANSPFFGIELNRDFVEPGEVEVDQNGTIWAVNMGETSTGPMLVAFDKDSNSYGYSNILEENRVQRALAIDFSNTKWLGGMEGLGRGLVFFNENGTLDNKFDDKKGTISTTDDSNLPSNEILAVETDKLGLVWLGTTRGVAVIVNPFSALQDKSSVVIRNLDRVVGEIKVNDIYIDALNNKWLATNSGLWVVDPDGAEVIATIDKDNSPLPTNEILSVTIDDNTGRVFIGTSAGIYESASLSVKPLTDYEIECYPQPFNLNTDNELVIEGLAEGSEVRILTANGKLVRSIRTQSRRTVWDGRDTSGEKVPNGIYIVVATSEISKESGTQKIAVIRK
jgi:hypothetical protein